MTDPTPTPPLDLAALKEQAELHEHYSRHRNMELSSSTLLTLIARVTAAESSLARYIVERTRFGDAMAANAVAPVVNAIMRELTADSDKRAREATARVEAAEAKIAAVRDLHKTVEIQDRGHIFRVCEECSDLGGDGSRGAVMTPCPTIAALDGTA